MVVKMYPPCKLVIGFSDLESSNLVGTDLFDILPWCGVYAQLLNSRVTCHLDTSFVIVIGCLQVGVHHLLYLPNGVRLERWGDLLSFQGIQRQHLKLHLWL